MGLHASKIIYHVQTSGLQRTIVVEQRGRLLDFKSEQ
jgi:hypothetical protein